VIDLMKSRHADLTEVQWILGDMRHMDTQIISDSSVDVAFDKGTLDAMIYGDPWNPPDDVRESAGAYMGEVHRSLKDDGTFLYVTFRQPHFARKLLNGEELWDLEVEVLGGEDGGFGYHAFTLRKKQEKQE
jgi:EEF1A lysine methyltransferase 4